MRRKAKFGKASAVKVKVVDAHEGRRWALWKEQLESLVPKYNPSQRGNYLQHKQQMYLHLVRPVDHTRV